MSCILDVALCVASSLLRFPFLTTPFNPLHPILQQHKGACRVDVLRGSSSPTLDLDRHRDVLDSDHQELAGGSILQERAIAQHFRRGGHQHQNGVRQCGKADNEVDHTPHR